MTQSEYKQLTLEAEERYREELSAISEQYTSDNALYKIGDVVSNAKGKKMSIKSAEVWISPVDKELHIVYHGVPVRQASTKTANDANMFMFEKNVEKVNGTIIKN